MRLKIAGAAVAAVAMGGCATATPNPNNDGVSSVETRLTLPSGEVINTLTYAVSENGVDVSEDIDVSNSSKIVFQVPNLPVADNYLMTLTATTVDGVACSGMSPFNIADEFVTSLAMTLTCGGGGEVDPDLGGDVRVEADVEIDDVDCPSVQGVGALPAETAVGSSVNLTGYHGPTAPISVEWTVDSDGTFGSADADATTYTCVSGGLKDVTYTVIGAEGCDQLSQTVVIECTGAVAEVEICSGGVDEDNDGLVDCDDDDCAADPACVTTEAEVCTGGVDEDQDGLVDCDDDDCDADPACVTTEAEICTGGVDEDQDGLVDCDDDDCAADPACVTTEAEICTGGVDEDEDGLVDCDDVDDCATDPACVTTGGDCDACVRTACSAYQGIDLIGPCFDDGDSVVPGSVPVPEFSQRCVDTFECSLNAGPCVQDPLGPAECACGAIDLVTCREQGPADDAPCADEWLSASDCPDGDWGCMLDLFSDVSLPSGYANYVIECMNASCTNECFPQ